MGINSKINRSPIEDIIVLIETILNVARIFDQKETRYHKIRVSITFDDFFHPIIESKE